VNSEAVSEPQRNLTVDALEAGDGRAQGKLEGAVPELANEAELREALEQAFDYRGDVTITRKDGSRVEGYIFDRRSGPTLAESFVRIIPNESASAQVSVQEKDANPSASSGQALGHPQKISIPYSDIAALAFSGRDMAAGKSWEAWVRNYWGKKAAGEKGIGLEPEKLE
jgi:hypothetical protein